MALPPPPVSSSRSSSSAPAAEVFQQTQYMIRRKILKLLGGAFHVYDARQGKVGALRRKALKSFIRDEWLILDAGDREVGMIQEDSTGLAIVRRLVDFASMFMPQKYFVTVGGVPVASFQQNFNPFVYKLVVDLSPDRTGIFDRRLALAGAILMAAIEGKQS